MYWGDKMDIVIKEVLGDNHYLLIASNNSFKILKDGYVVATCSSKYMLKDHWRSELGDTLKIIQEQKIQKALSKV
jgi:hypothetical protein